MTRVTADGDPVEPPVEKTIAEIQGDGAASPLAGKDVITTGVVTAVYKTGGFSGAYMQTDGTGGAIDLATHTRLGRHLRVLVGVRRGGRQGRPRRGHGQGQRVQRAHRAEHDDRRLAGARGPPRASSPPTVPFPLSAAQRESLEGMLLQPAGDFTITNNYTTNQYAEIGLAAG